MPYFNLAKTCGSHGLKTSSTSPIVCLLALALIANDVLAGLWSQIKRAPKAKKVRKTFEVAGPGQAGALPLDERARQLFAYFKNYNYELVETGETIKFAGTYKASRGQAAALIFYVFCGTQSFTYMTDLSVLHCFMHIESEILVCIS